MDDAVLIRFPSPTAIDTSPRGGQDDDTMLVGEHLYHLSVHLRHPGRQPILLPPGTVVEVKLTPVCEPSRQWCEAR